MDSLDDIFEQEAARQREEAEREDNDTLAKIRAANKRRADFDKGVRLGWWDAEGNVLVAETEEPEDEDAEEEPEE